MSANTTSATHADLSELYDGLEKEQLIEMLIKKFQIVEALEERIDELEKDNIKLESR